MAYRASRNTLRQDLAELRGKYVELVEMRREREALAARGILRFEGEALAQRNARSRALAQRFPGVLRELDVLEASTLEQRLADVDAEIAAAERDPHRAAPERPWVRLIIDFHRELRQALAIKRWIAGHDARGELATSEIVEAFRAWFSACPARVVPMEQVDAAFLNDFILPPNRRLTALVWEHLAQRHGVSEAEAKRMLFEPPGWAL